MKLLRVHLHNFRTHKDTEIDFTQLGSPVLIKGINMDETGSNGAGKTSIFKAIEYILYSEKKNYLSWGETSGYVELEFFKDGITHKINKEFTEDDYKVTLYKDGELVSTAKSEIEKYIRGILKISRNLFEQTIYQRQGFSNFFSYLTPKMKSAFIAELLNLEKWEKYYETANIHLKFVNQAVTKMSTMAEVIRHEIEDLQVKIDTTDIEKIRLELKNNIILRDSTKNILSSLGNPEVLVAKRNSLLQNITDSKAYVAELIQIKNNLLSEIDKYKEIIGNLEKKRSNPIDESHRQSLLSSVLSMEKQIAALEQEKTIKEADGTSLVAKYNSVIEHNKCPYCLRGFNTKAEFDEYLFNISAQINESLLYIEGLKTKITNLNAMKLKDFNMISELNTKADQYTSNLKGITDTQATLQDKLQLFDTYDKLYIKENNNLVQYKTEYDINEVALSTTSIDKLTELQNTLATVEENIATLSTSKIGYEHMFDNKNEKEIYLRKIIKELDNYGRAQKMLKHVANMFSSTGIQKWLFTNALEEFSLLANSFLEPMNYTLTFILEKHKANDPGYKPAFDIMVTKKLLKKSCMVDDLSGGEKSMVDFAVRLAFSTIMASAHNFEFMIIDEGFGDMDLRKKEIVADICIQLSKQFQIFIITNLVDFEEHFLNRLYVTKTNDISEVEAM